jgi:chorismate mutase / prephenate dehydratase
VSGGDAAAVDTQQLRGEIDRVDAEIVARLLERARLASRIGAVKRSADQATYAPAREREVLERVQDLSGAGPLQPEHLVAIYREIISACRAVEQPLRVAYFGPAATFTHQAAIGRFGHAAELVPIGTIPDVFAETQRGNADFGVVPVENSTEGPVHQTLDTFIDSDLKVRSEIVLPIRLHLMSHARIEDVQRIYSNPVAYGQCREWIARTLPGRPIVDAVSTARAAMAAAEDSSGAAVGPELAASEYGLEIIARDIQDLTSNYTRFYVIGQPSVTSPTGRDRTAVAFSIRDHVGALRDVADIFAGRSINLSSIQSRPSRRRAWDYVFFVELAGHEAEPDIREALGELTRECAFVKVLGSWPDERQ